MVTDPVSDFIIRLKNAGAVRKERVHVPHSKFTMAIAQKLQDAGFVATVETKGKKTHPTIEVALRYTDAGQPKIRGLKRMSKPGRRLYRRVHEIHPVRYGQGALILSTPAGVMTGDEARKARIGGEALFEIW